MPFVPNVMVNAFVMLMPLEGSVMNVSVGIGTFPIANPASAMVMLTRVMPQLENVSTAMNTLMDFIVRFVKKGIMVILCRVYLVKHVLVQIPKPRGIHLPILAI